jgi:histidinol-phosphate aminotransferase
MGFHAAVRSRIDLPVEGAVLTMPDLPMTYERTNIEDLTPYTPGEQPRHVRMVKLNTNENPYPPAQAVLQAIAQVGGESLRRYPPPSADAFREAAAEAFNLSPEQIIATNGGDELLRMAITTFCLPRPPVGRGGADRGDMGGIAVAEPSYSLYPVLAAIHDTPVARISLCEDWSLPDDFARRVIDAGARLAIIVNPHAPSGHLEPWPKLEAIARQLVGHAVLMIDEAYVDFAVSDALPLLDASRGLDNVLLLRTLSKGYSLAGLRFGFGLGGPSLINALHKVRDSYNTDILAQTAATAALKHRDQARESWQRVMAERRRLGESLAARSWQVLPSESNFLLATPPAKAAAAAEIYQLLKQQGICVRYFDEDRLRDKLRITIGTPEQNDALLSALDAI